MSAEAVPMSRTKVTIHPLWVRITHWINALAMVLMIGSGWQIYDASPLPLFQFEFPTSITLGGDLPTGLAWHFAAMWLLALDGIGHVGLCPGFRLVRAYP